MLRFLTAGESHGKGLVVILEGMSPHRTVAKAAEVIGRERILGVVLNRVQNTDTSHDGYYYSSYYGSSTTLKR